MSTTRTDAPGTDGSPAAEQEQGTPPVPARRGPRDVGEQIAGLWPPRWDLWPFGEGSPLHDLGMTVGSPIRVEQVRDGDELVVRAELPGLDPDSDIDLTVEDGLLTIAAHRQESTERREKDGYRSEFRYGRSERQIRLPRGAGTDAVSAAYRDGVLEVRVPVPSEQPGVRKVDVHRA